MIQPTYVTFEQAVALKEKGFNEELSTVYNLKSEPTKSHYNTMKNSDIEHGTICTRPEQWMVIEWLNITYNIWIYVDETYRPYIIKDGKNLIHNGELNRLVPYKSGFMTKYAWESPQEAILAAFDYILTNLI